MKILIYFMIGFGWVIGYDMAQEQHPTKIAKSDSAYAVTGILLWPVFASCEVSRFLYSNSAESYNKTKN
jgi:hypothetical protein